MRPLKDLGLERWVAWITRGAVPFDGMYWREAQVAKNPAPVAAGGASPATQPAPSSAGVAASGTTACALACGGWTFLVRVG